MARILLASGSPRRRDLLKMIAPDFEVVSGKEVDETYPSDLNVYQVPSFLSQLKAEPYRDELGPDDILITADTVVILDDHILGKPHSRAEAIEMLMSMQGKTHIVVTGMTLTTATSSQTLSQETSVEFDRLTLAEVEYYVDTYRPYDKAGAYGIQEWIGAAAITGIRGSFYNVMGLPIHTLYKELHRRGVL